MLPRAPIDYIADSRGVHAVAPSEFSPRHAESGEPAHLQHVGLGQFGARMLATNLTLRKSLKYVSGVVYVGLWRQVLKVASAIVSLVAIDVVDFVAVWAWAVECRRDERVNALIAVCAIHAKSDVDIAARVVPEAQDATDSGALVATVSANASERGHRVERLKAGHREPPFFVAKHGGSLSVLPVRIGPN